MNLLFSNVEVVQEECILSTKIETCFLQNEFMFKILFEEILKLSEVTSWINNFATISRYIQILWKVLWRENASRRQQLKWNRRRSFKLFKIDFPISQFLWIEFKHHDWLCIFNEAHIVFIFLIENAKTKHCGWHSILRKHWFE